MDLEDEDVRSLSISDLSDLTFFEGLWNGLGWVGVRKCDMTLMEVYCLHHVVYLDTLGRSNHSPLRPRLSFQHLLAYDSNPCFASRGWETNLRTFDIIMAASIALKVNDGPEKLLVELIANEKWGSPRRIA